MGEFGNVSSVGSLGMEHRSFDRMYYVPEQQVDADRIDAFEDSFNTMVNDMTNPETRTSRVVSKAVFTGEAVSLFLNRPKDGEVEVVYDLTMRGYSDDYLVVYSKTNPDRRGHPDEEIFSNTEGSELPRNYEDLRLPDGYSLDNQIKDSDIDDIERLWGTTFGWAKDDILSLKKYLEEAKYQPRNFKQRWFGGVRNTDGKFVSIATAERLDIPTRHGNLVTIENTEWSTDPSERGKGLISSAIHEINTQVEVDFADETRRPLIFAEFNYSTRADKAAIKAGMSIPRREIQGRPISQILHSNVQVVDAGGKNADFNNFTFLVKEF